MLARELQMGDQVTTVMMWVSPHTVTCRPLLAYSVMNRTCSIEGIAISPCFSLTVATGVSLHPLKEQSSALRCFSQ